MHVFVTGSTGYVGSAVVRALVKAQHQVTGLVRSAEKAAALEAIGGKPIRGDLKDAASFRDAAAHTLERARQIMGPFADRLCTDQVVVTKRSVELGWKAAHKYPLDAMALLVEEWYAEAAKR